MFALKGHFKASSTFFTTLQIRHGCLTCVSFDAVREFIIGKTQPMPVRIYDYYEPEYETSQFYNASHMDELTQDLCEDEACNKIRQDVDQPGNKSCAKKWIGRAKMPSPIHHESR